MSTQDRKIFLQDKVRRLEGYKLGLFLPISQDRSALVCASFAYFYGQYPNGKRQATV